MPNIEVVDAHEKGKEIQPASANRKVQIRKAATQFAAPA
jgi:hypothetical protein